MKMNVITSGWLILMLLILASCTRVSEHEAAFFRCLNDQSALGEDFRESLLQLETYLLENNYLRSVTRDDYMYLLRSMISGSVSISTQNAAPEVRDFWYLENPSTFGAYPACAEIIDENYQLSETRSLKRMARLYSQTGFLSGADTESGLADLAESISADDFEKILYRGALLVYIVRLME